MFCPAADFPSNFLAARARNSGDACFEGGGVTKSSAPQAEASARGVVICCSLRRLIDAFENGGGADSACGADTHDGGFFVCKVQLVRHGGDHAAAGCGEGVAECDGTAVYVEAIDAGDADFLLQAETLLGEGIRI